jgi:phosphate transport system substrate-binding protein
MALIRSFLVLGLALLFLSCSKPSGEQKAAAGEPAADKPVVLNGAGATFPFPLYSKWVAEYNRQKPHIRINYQSIGSGGGIRQIVAQTVDFGATDAPMKADEAAKAKTKIVHIPTTIGAVVVAYNVPELSAPLKLSSDALAAIYLGKITKWNDPALKALNPELALPDRNIAVVYRSDGSGTTSVFTDYLAAVSPEWKEKVGAGKSVSWPVGLGAKGNEGVTGQTKTMPGSIGYVESAYAKQNKLPVAHIKNKAGAFIEPSTAATTAAAQGVALPDSLYVSLVNPDDPAAYPIASYTYILVYEDSPDKAKAAALAEFLWWAVHDGQKYAAELDYAPLPAVVVSKVEAALKGLRANGQPILQ